MQILVLNSGSSSLKFALLDPESGETRLSGLAERLGQAGARIRLDQGGAGQPERTEESLSGGSYAEAVARVMAELDALGVREEVAAVGHRVVHGGEAFAASALITPEVEQAIRECVPLAPLHNPANLAGIDAARTAFSDLPHVAVFDTAFHQTMPPAAYRYAVPEHWYTDYGVRRYGFHGTSHQFVAAEAARMLGRDPAELGLVTAHLGNGSSVAAVQGGQSRDSSMGLTPLEGLIMGTRSGDVDPALHDYLAREANLTLPEITAALNRESGLLGLSGLTNDMRELEAAAGEGHAGAALALDAYVHRLARYIGAMTASLDRLDALVFTGGIGENSSLVRARTVARLRALGLTLDDSANAANVRGQGGVISASDSRAAALVVNTNEELMIARQTREVVRG